MSKELGVKYFTTVSFQAKKWDKMFRHQVMPFLKTCYMYEYSQYRRSVLQVWHRCIQGENNKKTRSKF